MIASILAAIGALGTIIGALLYFYKSVKATPEQKKENVDKSVEDEKQNFENTGRPS